MTIGRPGHSLRAEAPWRVSNGHVLNFVNTLAGAAVAPLLFRSFGSLS